MALPAVAGATILASDLYALCRPSGGAETGKYWQQGNAYTAAQTVCWVPSLSRNATPVSVSIDTADQAPSGGSGTPATFNLTSGGFHTSAQTTGATTNAYAGGNYTINY